MRAARIVLLLLGVSGVGTAALAQEPAPGSGDTGFAQELSMSQRANSQKQIIEHFSQLAAKGDIDALMAMLDPRMRAAQDDASIREAFRKLIIPYYADFQSVDGYEGVNPASLPDGRTGLWHYGYIVSTDGRKKPVSIALVDQDGKTYVATANVGQCVLHRHPVSKGRCDGTTPAASRAH